jgi:pyruvate dehydrogenase E2 component (dihydrolipoamide acetyltransferase)
LIQRNCTRKSYSFATGHKFFLGNRYIVNQIDVTNIMDVKLPKLGEGADSGVVVNVFVKEGDTLAKDQPILELENEKAIASIPSSAAGIVAKVHVKAGDKISVGQRLVTLSEVGQPASVAAPAAEAEPAQPETKLAAFAEEPPVAEEEVPQPVAAPVASPSIRKIARELGIDLTRVRGSEAGGRIVMADIRTYIQRLQQGAGRGRAGSPLPAVGTARSGVRVLPAAPEQIDFSKWGPVSKKPLSPLRQVIARRMWENWNTIPHVTQFDEADFTTINNLRKKHAPAYEQQGMRLTVTPFVLKALVETLKKHPILNSSFDEAAQEIVLKEYFHIGIAVDTEQGLIVPVIRDADKKNMLELSKELEQLAQKARDRKVTAEELKGGTFTISNQGAIGSAHFTPIINKPEVALLGLGRGALKPVVRDGKVEVRMLVPLALSYDHRVIDGGAAARFMVDLVRALEDFPEGDVKI